MATWCLRDQEEQQFVTNESSHLVCTSASSNWLPSPYPVDIEAETTYLFHG